MGRAVDGLNMREADAPQQRDTKGGDGESRRDDLGTGWHSRHGWLGGSGGNHVKGLCVAHRNHLWKTSARL